MPVTINGQTGSDNSISPKVEEQKEKVKVAPIPAVDNNPKEVPVMEEQSIAHEFVAASGSPSDPNSITVTICDKETPIVILYGPPACGKTMTLVRLTRYLKDKGYQVVPDKSFRDSQDAGYKKLCDNFNDMISSNDAAESTAGISFMLVRILDSKGHPVCQILEAPGEHYYLPGEIKHEYAPYISRIINSNNRKVWVVMIEPDWESSDIRHRYVDNIKYLNNKLNGKSKVLFVYNKVDRSFSQTKKDTIQEVSNHYPSIFEPFRNLNPITHLWKPYNCDLVRFSTGDYAETAGGGMTYTPSDDAYPKALWECLLRFIRG